MSAQPALQYLERRRSLRISVRVPLIICYGGRLNEPTRTLCLNRHGVLVPLAAGLEIGQSVLVQNPENWAERHARVISFGRHYAGRTEVGLEFTSPAPDFWLMETAPLYAR